jgi:chaperonin cofactor prefoldin
MSRKPQQIPISNILKNHELRLQTIEKVDKNDYTDKTNILTKEEIITLIDNLKDKFDNLKDKYDSLKDNYDSLKDKYDSLKDNYDNLNELYMLQNLDFFKSKQKMYRKEHIKLEFEEDNSTSYNITNELNESAKISDEINQQEEQEEQGEQGEQGEQDS